MLGRFTTKVLRIVDMKKVIVRAFDTGTEYVIDLIKDKEKGDE